MSTSVRKCAGGNYGESAEGSGTGWQLRTAGTKISADSADRPDTVHETVRMR